MTTMIAFTTSLPCIFLLAAPFFLVFVYFLKSPGGRGKIGEVQARLSCFLLLNKRDYRILNNVTLPLEEGTTQIDHIIVSTYGVFVVETKNYNGAIYGSENDKTWTQKIGRQTHKFQNPLRQNYRHTRSLSDLLRIPHEQIRSVIAFVGDATFGKEMPENVRRYGGFAYYIREFREPVFTDDQVSQMVERIEASRLTATFVTERAHVEYLRNRHKGDSSSSSKRPAGGWTVERSASLPEVPPDAAPPPCPQCGQAMVMRRARKGPITGNQFWGCPEYPSCRGIIQIEPLKD